MDSYRNKKIDSSDDIVIDIGDFIYRCWHNLPVIIAVTLLCAVLSYIGTSLFIAPTYSASADMMVNNNQESNMTTTITSSDLMASTSLVDTYAVILTSHNVLEKVIEDLELPYTYNRLANMIDVSAVDETQVMRITVYAGSSAEALNIADAIVERAPDAIMDAADVGSVKTIDSPWSTGRPVAPNKSKNTAIGGMLGLVVCCAVILIRMMTSNTFKTEADIKDILDLPVLAIIPLDKNGRN